MAIYKIQGKTEKRQGIYYEFDSDDKPLGEGGMGKVYRGRCVDEQTGIAHDVAIKFMFSDLPPYAIEKARREASIHFRHDNLVEMLGFIETESKTVLGETVQHYHVVSELLQGVSLDKLFEGKLTDQEGNFVPYAEKLFKDYQHDPNHFAVEIVKNILKGLMSMHDAGYIHRDIDPTNIMITADGHIKLIDFGIAKKMNSLTTNDKHMTKTGQFVGKPEYAAPELVLGAINEQNQTTDIYAVGILLFQCIVGRVPFTGDTNDVMQKQLHSKLPLNLIKHKGLRKIIATATEKSREKRYRSSAEFRVALEQLDLNNPGFEWKPLYTYIIGGVAACAIVAALLLGGGKKEEAQAPSYAQAVMMLKSPSSAAEGVKVLEGLSDAKDAQATYLLSRLYFESREASLNVDSIRSMRQTAGLKVDNQEAHRLLIKAVEQDKTNYHYSFELALDFWGAEEYAEGLAVFDENKAELMFKNAEIYATKAGDTAFAKRVKDYLNDIEDWKSN